MEEVLLRFPQLGQKIFKLLSNENLIKCKSVCRSWNLFITNEKFYKKRKQVFCENLQKTLDKHGNTFLHKAAKNGDLQKCKLVIDNVESKNPVNNHGDTPLHKAAMKGHLDICKLIIEKVEDKNPAKKYGGTPLHEVAYNGHIDICKLIIEKVADKNPASYHGCTPLHVAATEGHLDILQTHY